LINDGSCVNSNVAAIVVKSLPRKWRHGFFVRYRDARNPITPLALLVLICLALVVNRLRWLRNCGADLVRDWLRSLDDSDQNTIGLDLMRVQFRWPVGMPLCRAMGDGLWEMRTNLPSNRIARLLFCVAGDRILVLHGFIKKTQKTPDEELTRARRRKKEIGV
jgi:phage-related protein